MQHVIVTSKTIDLSALRADLESYLDEIDGVSVDALRAADPALLIALVGAGSAILGSVISGVLAVVTQKGASQITIEGKSGRKIVVPVGTTSERLDEYLDAARRLDVDHIEVG